MKSSIDAVLDSAVEQEAVPNVVAMAADADGVIYEGAAGPRAAGGSDPVTPDTMLRLASMTKMVVTVAALQQVERGNLHPSTPVEEYCPEFAGVQVLTGFDGDTPLLRPPASRATVEHLMTHTSGASYWFWNADLLHFEQVTGTPNVLSGSNAIFGAPLVADPGVKFEYGINIDWLGKVVEVVSGLSLDKYVGEYIFEPLRMTKTAFFMSDEQRANSAPVHVRADDGTWVVTELDWAQEPDYWAGGHGLYSTPRDYLQFQRMLLGDGTLGDATVLQSATVAAAFTNQIGDIEIPSVIRTADPASTADFIPGPGMKWGLGLLLNTEDQPGRRRAGSGAWAGIFNTYFWVDPAAGITGAFYSQCLPFVDPPVTRMYEDFERALYAGR